MSDTGQSSQFFPDVSGLLAPKSIAIVGASDRPGNLGGMTVRFLQKFGYPGEIWPVNPNQQTVAGLRCFPRVSELPGPADLAILAVAAGAISGMVRECAEAGTMHGVVWAGGFAEVGGEGIERQKALVEACGETGFKLCGPNCIGIINTAMPMTASFASSLFEMDKFLAGNISIVSQSGGMATIIQALAQQAGFGFRQVISSGNEAVLTAADYIHALATDSGTKVIAAYIEGVKDGAKFLAALQSAREAQKPVVILKGGATAASARAAVAHTGALAGEDRVWDAVFREMSVIRVHSQEELLDVVMVLSGTDLHKLPKGNGVASLTFGGGPGVLSADQCAREGLATPALEPDAQERLRPLVPPIASIANPFDLTPDAYNQPSWLALFPQAMDVIASDPNIHTLFFQCGATSHKAEEIMDEILGIRSRTDKTVVVAWGLTPRSVLKRLPAEGVYPFPEYARAIRAIGHLVRYRAGLSRPPRPDHAVLTEFDWSRSIPNPKSGMVISEHDCHRLLATARLPVAAGRLAASADEAVRASSDVGYPVALKGISPAVTHRAAAGLLALDIRSDFETREAYQRLVGRAQEIGVDLEGAYVQHMESGGLELLVSAFRDPQFGVIVSCGAGGNFTELIDDVTLERAPLDEALAIHMLNRLRIMSYGPKLARGASSQAVAQFLVEFSQLAMTAPWKRFVLEVNPIKWSSNGVVAVDGLLVIEEA